jgi:transcriptional regulator with XRE-family HTH domain
LVLGAEGNHGKDHRVINRDEFQARMKQIRKDTGLTTRKFEKEIISMSSWYSYEHGKCMPGLETAYLICNTLGINLQWFVNGTGPKIRR